MDQQTILRVVSASMVDGCRKLIPIDAAPCHAKAAWVVSLPDGDFLIATTIAAVYVNHQTLGWFRAEPRYNLN